MAIQHILTLLIIFSRYVSQRSCPLTLSCRSGYLKTNRHSFRRQYGVYSLLAPRRYRSNSPLIRQQALKMGTRRLIYKGFLLRQRIPAELGFLRFLSMTSLFARKAACPICSAFVALTMALGDLLWHLGRRTGKSFS